MVIRIAVTVSLAVEPDRRTAALTGKTANQPLISEWTISVVAAVAVDTVGLYYATEPRTKAALNPDKNAVPFGRRSY